MGSFTLSVRICFFLLVNVIVAQFKNCLKLAFIAYDLQARVETDQATEKFCFNTTRGE